jgi:5'-nucleotidase
MGGQTVTDGGTRHDHHYAHQLVNGVHVIRSGCDFKQLSYIEVRRRSSGWDFDIVRQDITAEMYSLPFPASRSPSFTNIFSLHRPEDPETAKLVDTLTVGLKAKLQKPVGFTSVPLDARFTVIRRAESNFANFVCDLMRFYYSTDCAIMAGGTMRGDQIYPPGVIKLGDIVNCFPFEDPVIVVRVTGKGILDALENGVSKIPALEGRFPHVSNISFTFDPSAPSGARILECKIAGDEVVPDKKYSCAVRYYMATGRDGFVSLSPDQGAEQVLDEENGVLISTIIRQYFLSLKVLGRWRHGSTFRKLFSGLKHDMKSKGQLQQSEECRKHEELSDDDIDSESEDDDESLKVEDGESKDEKVVELLNKFGGKWARLARKGEMEVDWTSAVSPKVEGRIREVKRE